MIIALIGYKYATGFAHQSERCDKRIYLDKYGIYFRFYKDKDTVQLDRRRYIIVKRDDCKGNLYVKEFLTKSDHIVFEGAYVQYKDTVITTNKVLDPFTVKVVKTATNYHLTRRDGIWLYYSDSNNTIVKKEVYDKGSLLKY